MPKNLVIIKIGNTMKKIFLLLVVFCCLQSQAADLIVQQRSGAQLIYDVEIIGKWIYIGEDLQLIDKSGNILATEPVLEIKKIVFATANSISNPESELDKSILVYPNPTQDILMIEGIQAQPLRVYDLKGNMILQEMGTQIKVGHLANGTYLIQIGTQVARFIKK